MKTATISFGKKDKETGEEFNFTITKALPESMDEALQVYGEDVTFNLFIRKIKQDLQNACRSSEDNDAAQKVADEYTPGVAKQRQPSELKQLMALMKEKSVDEINALIAQAKSGQVNESPA